MERVSLYIPAYNSASWIKSCLESALSQTQPFDEILLIDDGSTDKTLDIARNYPVKIISHNTNRGIAAARNTGLQNSRNNLVASLDSDSTAGPKWLEHILPYIAKDTVAGVNGPLIETNCKGIANKWRSIHMNQSWGQSYLENPPFLYGNNSLFKKNILNKIGQYNKIHKTNYEDIDISRRILKAGYKLIYTPEAKTYHHRKDTIMSALERCWKWNFAEYYTSDNLTGLMRKSLYNLRLAASFSRRDVFSLNLELIPFDIFLAGYHSFLDCKYYKRKQ
jgi:glycosyltransferase involved in cell wall biosynthesis